MANQKRSRAAAIVLQDGKIVSMYREFNGRKYNTFPGGGMEEGEKEEECVKREVFEEFGIQVEIVKKLYDYEDEKSIEHFYLCKWVAGEFGTGKGEEFQPGRNRGIYKPMFINVLDIPNLTLFPDSVAKTFYEDYKKFGERLDGKVKKIVGHRI